MNHEARPDDDDDDNRAEEVRELFKKLRREKLRPKNTTGGEGWGGVSDAKKTQLFPQKVILLATIYDHSRIPKTFFALGLVFLLHI